VEAQEVAVVARAAAERVAAARAEAAVVVVAGSVAGSRELEAMAAAVRAAPRAVAWQVAAAAA